MITFEEIINFKRSSVKEVTKSDKGITIHYIPQITDIQEVKSISDLIIKGCSSLEELGLLTNQHISNVIDYISVYFRDYAQMRLMTVLGVKLKHAPELSGNPAYSDWLFEMARYGSLYAETEEWREWEKTNS